MFLGVARLFRERNVVLDANVAAALHSLRSLEAAVLALDPRLGRIRLLRRFFVQSAVRMARAATRRKERADAMMPPAESSPDVPYDMLDQTERQAETVSEQSLQFANTASKPAYMFEQFFSGLRFLVVVAAFLTIILFVDQEIDRMDTLRGEDLGRWLTMMPQLSWLEYTVAAVVESWLFVLFHRITLDERRRYR
jgi:hypothetical protein